MRERLFSLDPNFMNLTLLNISVAASLAAVFASAQTTPVVQLQNLAHTTESLEKTLRLLPRCAGLTGERSARSAGTATAKARRRYVEVHGAPKA